MPLPDWMKALPAAPLLGWRQGTDGRPFLVTYPGDKGLLTVAPNRSGKGVSCIGVNAICHRFGSFVCVDPKFENTDLFARWRAIVLGQPTFVFDPLQVVPEAALPPAPVAGKPTRAGFNPIEFLRTARNPVPWAKMMAAALNPIEGNNPFFPKGAQAFFAASMCFVALDPFYPHPRTMRSLWHDLAGQSESDFKAWLEIMAISKAADGFAAREALEWIGGNQDTLKGVRKTLKTDVGRILDDPQILDCLSYTSLDFGDLQRRPLSVFFVLPGWASDIYSGFMRLLLTCMFAQIERAGLPPAGSRPPKTLIIVDETATLRRAEFLREALPRLPGYGVQFWPFVQDFNQLRVLYENGWETFVSNAGVVQFFGGAPDVFTAEYLSRMMGNSTVNSISVSDSTRIGGGSTTTGSTGRPLMFPHEITNMNARPVDEYKQGLIFAGRGMAHAQRLLYYRDFPEFSVFLKRQKIGPVKDSR